MGEALAPFRQEVVIATKTMARDAATAEQHLAQSLKDLRTDYIDIYQAHNVSTEDDLEKLLAPGGIGDFMFKAKQKGLIRHMGISSHHPDIALKAVETGLFETLQFPINFLETKALEKLFPRADDLGMGIIGMKPLGGGVLEDARLCFEFLRYHSHVVPIPGVQSVAELDEIVDLYENPRPFEPEDLDEMERIRAELGNNFCRRCGYCQPCPQGIQIPMVLLFKAQVKRFDPAQVIEMGRERMAQVEECIECGECVEKCPYDLPIPDLIRETAELYRRFAESGGKDRP